MLLISYGAFKRCPLNSSGLNIILPPKAICSSSSYALEDNRNTVNFMNFVSITIMIYKYLYLKYGKNIRLRNFTQSNILNKLKYRYYQTDKFVIQISFICMYFTHTVVKHTIIYTLQLST